MSGRKNKRGAVILKIVDTPSGDEQTRDMGAVAPPDVGQQTPGTDKPHSYDDQLQYIEDMAIELKEMAARHGFEALSGILDIASREARYRREN